MGLNFAECLSARFDPPQVLLNAATGLMRFYRLFLKTRMLLQRFVQYFRDSEKCL